MPTIASSVRSWTWLRRSPPGSNVAGSKSRWATTMTRSPAAAMRSFASRARWRFSSVTGCERPVRVPVRPAARDQHVGRALHVAAHDRPAVLPGHLVERRHELVLGVERDLGDPGVRGPRLLDVETALGPEHDQGALGRVADQALAVEHRVGAQDHREQVGVEVELRPADVLDLTLGAVALAGDREAVLPRDRHLAGGHLVERQGARSCRSRSRTSTRGSRPPAAASRWRCAARSPWFRSTGAP